jgi:hypothetical protein
MPRLSPRRPKREVLQLDIEGRIGIRLDVVALGRRDDRTGRDPDFRPNASGTYPDIDRSSLVGTKAPGLTAR